MELIFTLAMKFWQWTILIAVVIIGAIINFTDKRKKPNMKFELTKEFGFEYLYENNKKSSWSLAWSWACYCFEITRLEMVENFFYAWSANQLSAALRIIPIGSTKAQLIQRDLLAIISKVSKEIMDKEIDDIYFGNVGLAMAQQNHNDLYTKLFRN